MHRFAVLALLAGCYNPNPGVGGPCSEQGFCPIGQMCYGGKCLTSPPDNDAAIDAEIDAPDNGQRPDSSVDAAKDAAIDAAIDAPADAALDAFVSPTWLTPTKIPGITGTGNGDPSLTADHLTIVFQRNDDLFIGTRASTAQPFTVVALTTLNTTSSEASPSISPNGTAIYFTTDRVVGNGGDVYVSTFAGGMWGAPTKVVELSTAADETDIGISRDGLTAVLSRSNTTILLATRATTASTWNAPVAISGVTWPASVAAPSINDAGDIYMHGKTPRDLFVARKLGASYGPPTAISELNTIATRDAAPEISGDDLYMAFEVDGELWETHR